MFCRLLLALADAAPTLVVTLVVATHDLAVRAAAGTSLDVPLALAPVARIVVLVVAAHDLAVRAAAGPLADAAVGGVVALPVGAHGLPTGAALGHGQHHEGHSGQGEESGWCGGRVRLEPLALVESWTAGETYK